MGLDKELIEKIEKHIENKNITKRKHPEEDLYILNYTIKAAYNKEWDEATKMCRGLIIDSDYSIIARPFPKFFNYEEYTDLVFPEKFAFYEKIDGSLGIMYYASGTPRISTRGSFTSWQAERATEILNTKYKEWVENSWSEEKSKEYTVLFEIVYPENRIIVDYGETEDLFLLGAVRTDTGRSSRLLGTPFPEPQGFVCDSVEELIEYMKNTDTHEKEGFVVHFPVSDLRVKMKYNKYKEVAKTLNKLTKRNIWECLKKHGEIEKIIDMVPDEFHEEIRKVENELREKYRAIEESCLKTFTDTDKDRGRGKIARDFVKQKYSHILFSMLDEKDYSSQIWNIIRPDPKEDGYFFELPPDLT